jgi:hypothetical protein
LNASLQRRKQDDLLLQPPYHMNFLLIPLWQQLLLPTLMQLHSLYVLPSAEFVHQKHQGAAVLPAADLAACMVLLLLLMMAACAAASCAHH